MIGEVFLCDRLENGAGYCDYLAQPTEFGKLLQLGDATNANPDAIAAKWMSDQPGLESTTPHALECDTSCNLCMRDYYNLPYHGLLDWRLALDMVRLAADPANALDLQEPWAGIPNPWYRLVSGPEAPVPSMMKRIRYGPSENFAGLSGYVHEVPERRQIWIERHPLWQDDHPRWIAAIASAKSGFPGYQVSAMNPFIALRRPADYA